MSSLNLMERARRRWTALTPREQSLLSLSAGLVALALLWSLAIAPAWRTVRQAPQQQAQLQQQISKMQDLARRAEELRRSPVLAGAGSGATPDPAMPAGVVDEATLTTLAQALGEGAQAQVSGRRITLRLAATSGAQLRGALAIARSRLDAKVVEAQLKPGDDGIRGQIVLEWGARP